MTSTAALLIHGFGGDRSVWATVAPELESRGVVTHRLALAGHEGGSGEFVTTRAEDWIADLERGLDELRGRADRLAVVGYSMGATLAYLALARHAVDRAVLVSPALDVAASRRLALAGLARVGVRAIPRGLIGSNDDDQPPLPIPALRANLELKAQAAATPLRDPAPTLLLSGGADRTVGPEAARRVLERFPAGTRLVTLAGADHDLPGGPFAREVAALVTAHVLGDDLAGDDPTHRTPTE